VQYHHTLHTLWGTVKIVCNTTTPSIRYGEQLTLCAIPPHPPFLRYVTHVYSLTVLLSRVFMMSSAFCLR